MAESKEELKSLLLRVKEESEKAGLEKAEEPEIKLPTSAGSWKKQEFQKNIYLCFIDYAKVFDYATVYCDPHSQRLWHSQ